MKTLPFKTYQELFKSFTKSENKYFLNYLFKGEYKNISTSLFKNKVLSLAKELKNIGIKENDTVAICAVSSPFWLIFDFALHQIGAVSVPIFANISIKNLNFELNDANISYIFIDDKNTIKNIKKDLVFITHTFEDSKNNFYCFDDLFYSNTLQQEIHADDIYKTNENDIFSIIYTSGNTGTPKGVVLSNKNIISQINDIDFLIHLKKDEIILSLLPLAHIFERTVMSYYLSKNVSIYFVDEITNVANLLKIVKPTMMTAVPRLLEKIYNKIKTNIESKPLISKILASLAFSYAMRYDINKQGFIYKLFDKIVYIKFREIFGSRLQKLVSGGAPLNKDICNFFVNIGINIYQGYGLSEFSPVISTNAPDAQKVGSCGKLLKSAEIKFLDKEILVKGPSLMREYLNQKELTKNTIDDEGWLHTGDIGHMDEEGYLYVSSRKKEIFKSSTGEYVNAVFLEQELSKNKYIEFSIIIANNKKYVSALLFVDKDKYLLEKQKNTDLSIEAYYANRSIINEIDKHIKKINKNLNSWERIVKYTLILNDISIETGELTPSMKICRNKIEELYEVQISTMY